MFPTILCVCGGGVSETILRNFSCVYTKKTHTKTHTRYTNTYILYIKSGSFSLNFLSLCIIYVWCIKYRKMHALKICCPRLTQAFSILCMFKLHVSYICIHDCIIWWSNMPSVQIWLNKCRQYHEDTQNSEKWNIPHLCPRVAVSANGSWA